MDFAVIGLDFLHFKLNANSEFSYLDIPWTPFIWMWIESANMLSQQPAYITLNQTHLLALGSSNSFDGRGCLLFIVIGELLIVWVLYMWCLCGVYGF